MSVAEHVLTDVANSIYVEHFELTGATLPLSGSTDWSIRKRRLKGGLSDGVDVVEIHNGALQLEVLPTRGMGLWRGSFQGIPLGWDSPVRQPVHPAFVNQTERGGLGWLAGFNELLCRCGLSFMGPPGRDVDHNDHPILGELTLHGKIANLPAHTVSVSVDSQTGTISVTGIVDECSLFGPCLQLKSTLRTQVGSNRCTIVDEVTNLSAKPADFEMLYHTNIGQPFLEKDAKFVAPIQEFCPRDARATEGLNTFDRYAAPDAAYSEQAYLFHLAGDSERNSIALLHNAAGDLGLSLEFHLTQLPCFTLWKNTAAMADGYVTGLEPGTNFPNPRHFERSNGRVISLAPNGSHCMTLQLAIHPDRNSVNSVIQSIRAIQKATTATCHAKPLPSFSVAAEADAN